jgi:hypothetical protein
MMLGCQETLPSALILRVPVLYGPTTDVAESPALVLAKDVMQGKPKAVGQLD